MSVSRILFFLLVLCISGVAASAATLYQWKDASGHMHFVDNLSKVPAEYRSNSSRDMPALKPVVKATKNSKSELLDGRGLYESKCKACHLLGFETAGGREGLGWAIIDEKTKYPQPPDKLFVIIREAVDGDIDMPVMKISDKEVMAIADYLIKVSMP